MNRKISSKSSSNLQRRSSSRVFVPRNFSALPRLITSQILKNLELPEKLALRECSSGTKCHIDDHIRRKFIEWKRRAEEENEEFSHNKILLLSIEQFTALNFYPPYVLTLIDKAEKVRLSYESMWREYETPIRIEEKENLLRVFFEEADKTFDEMEKKIIFTLTMLQMLKALDPNFKMVHPFNRKARLRLDFKFQHLFFALPRYNFVFDWFSFDRDWIQMLLLLSKVLEIKAAESNSQLKWVDFIRPINFKKVTVFFGRKNPCKRVKSTSKVKSKMYLIADREMITEIKTFMTTGIFDWKKIAKEFSVECKFSCIRSKVCELKAVKKIEKFHNFKLFSGMFLYVLVRTSISKRRRWRKSGHIKKNNCCVRCETLKSSEFQSSNIKIFFSWIRLILLNKISIGYNLSSTKIPNFLQFITLLFIRFNSILLLFPVDGHHDNSKDLTSPMSSNNIHKIPNRGIYKVRQKQLT